MRIFSFCCLLALFFLGGCHEREERKMLRIGIDASWAPLDFDAMQPYVYGYTEDFLMEIAHYSGLEFEKINANQDTLLSGMSNHVYDAVLSYLPPYEFNQARYDFSDNYLTTGPVLVASKTSSSLSLQKLSNQVVGIISGSDSVLVLEANPDVIIRSYESIPDLLNAVVLEEITACVLDRLHALKYVRDLYSKSLKVVSDPLNQQGLHLVVLKGTHPNLLRAFNQGIERMMKKKQLAQLQQKWNLE